MISTCWIEERWIEQGGTMSFEHPEHPFCVTWLTIKNNVKWRACMISLVARNNCIPPDQLVIDKRPQDLGIFKRDPTKLYCSKVSIEFFPCKEYALTNFRVVPRDVTVKAIIYYPPVNPLSFTHTHSCICTHSN